MSSGSTSRTAPPPTTSSARAWCATLHGRSAAVLLRSSLDFVSRDNPFSSNLAKRELGWRPAVSHEVGVPDAFAWTAGHGRHDR